MSEMGFGNKRSEVGFGNEGRCEVMVVRLGMR